MKSWRLHHRRTNELRSDVELAPMDSFVRSAMIEEEWLSDEETNYRLGYGRGIEGRLEATQQIASAIAPESPVEALGIFCDGEPVGFAMVSPTVSRRRSREFFLFVRPESREQKIARTALSLLADHVLLGNDVRRMEIELLGDNRRAVSWLRHEGLTIEGRRTNGWWTPDGASHTTVLMRLLASEWKRWGRGDRTGADKAPESAGGAEWLSEPNRVESTQEVA